MDYLGETCPRVVRKGDQEKIKMLGGEGCTGREESKRPFVNGGCCSDGKEKSD